MGHGYHRNNKTHGCRRLNLTRVIVMSAVKQQTQRSTRIPYIPSLSPLNQLHKHIIKGIYFEQKRNWKMAPLEEMSPMEQAYRSVFESLFWHAPTGIFFGRNIFWQRRDWARSQRSFNYIPSRVKEVHCKVVRLDVDSGVNPAKELAWHPPLLS